MQRLKPLLLLLSLIGLYPISAQGQSTRGQLKDGKPVGVWEYYDYKELGLRFNYDSSRIQYSRPDTAHYLTLLDSGWQPKQLQRAPRVLGSNSDLTTAMQKQLRYPVQDMRAGTTGTVILTYVIDEQGRRTNPVATTAPTTSLAEEVYRVAESLPFTYIPAVYQGKRVPTKIAFVVRFCLCKAAEDCQAVSRAQVLATPKPLGSLSEVIVTAYAPGR